MSPPKIDVHSHVVPPFWREAARAAGKIPIPPAWDENTHLALMDRCNIRKTIVSITSPGSHLTPGDDGAARQLAHECNEFSAALKRRHPSRFGFFATLPLPDVQGSIAEIKHALDELGADGVGILTNHHGIYIGDARFDPVFEEMNRRGAKVFIHPTVPCRADSEGGGGLHSCMPTPNFVQGIFEYFFEEVRVVLNIIQSGTASRFPRIRFIIPHAGGALPPIVERFSRFHRDILHREETAKWTTQQIKELLQRQFYFDLAGFPLPDQLPGLLRMVDHTRLLYGSDFPYTPLDSTEMLARELESGISSVLPDAADKEGVFSANAMRLFGEQCQ
ncbi:hypothetical protein BJX65DRAFT_313616 [Aspergillus insuetus]